MTGGRWRSPDAASGNAARFWKGTDGRRAPRVSPVSPTSPFYQRGSRCLGSPVSYPPSAIHYLLSTVHCPLPTAHCPLSTAHCPARSMPEQFRRDGLQAEHVFAVGLQELVSSGQTHAIFESHLARETV